MMSQFARLDFSELLAQYPVGDGFTKWLATLTRGRLDELREERFRRLMDHAWTVPFYAERWRAAGVSPGDIACLDDIGALPTFDKSDIVEFYERSSFRTAIASGSATHPALILHTTSGTTGTPQPLVFSPLTREISNSFVARLYLWHGLRADDTVQSLYGHGMVNGGHHIREAVLHFTDSLFLSAGSGAETRSTRQIDLMRQFSTTVLVGFCDYIKHLAEVAREQGFEPGVDLPIRLIFGHLGTEGHGPVETAWPGATAVDWYGVGDTGMIAAEGPERRGLHIWEDAHHVEVLDSSTGQACTVNEPGDVVCTSLYKLDAFPMIRFNTHDVSHFLPDDATLQAYPLRRIAGFLGRSDNMVKLRGINFYPHAVASLITNIGDLNGEYVCIVERHGDRDELHVVVEANGAADPSIVSQQLERSIREQFSVSVNVEIVSPRATAHLTELGQRQKPIRLVDRRPSPS
jgi:phenylacetate-CoA ligase